MNSTINLVDYLRTAHAFRLGIIGDNRILQLGDAIKNEHSKKTLNQFSLNKSIYLAEVLFRMCLLYF